MGHLVSHHAEGGMKSSANRLGRRGVRQPKKPSGHPAMAHIFGLSAARLTSFVESEADRFVDQAVPLAQA
jgi:hypothetical protein